MDDKLSLLEKTIDEIESNLSETMRSVNDSRPSALEAPRTLERNVEAMGSLLRDFDSPASSSATARQQEMQPKAPAQRSSESGMGAKIVQDPLKDVGVVSQPLNKSLDSVSSIDTGQQSQSSQQTSSLSEAGQPIPLSKYGLPAGNPEQAAHTSADRMAMDLMDELRGKFLSDKPAKKEQEKSE